MPYIPGDFWRICDRSGAKVRASQTRKTWDGLWVRKEDWEPRHPQDFVTGKIDKQSVPEPRPEPADHFLSDNEARDEYLPPVPGIDYDAAWELYTINWGNNYERDWG